MPILGKTSESTAPCLTALLAIFLTSGCAVRDEATIKASTGALPASGTIDLVLPDETQADRLAFHAALTKAFFGSGRAIARDGQIIADFALSKIEADEELYFSEAGSEAPATTPIVDARRGSILDKCSAIRMRAKLVAYERNTGNLIASSEAEAIGCDDEDTPFAALAALLVEQVSN